MSNIHELSRVVNNIAVDDPTHRMSGRRVKLLAEIELPREAANISTDRDDPIKS